MYATVEYRVNIAAVSRMTSRGSFNLHFHSFLPHHIEYFVDILIEITF